MEGHTLIWALPPRTAPSVSPLCDYSTVPRSLRSEPNLMKDERRALRNKLHLKGTKKTWSLISTCGVFCYNKIIEYQKLTVATDSASAGVSFDFSQWPEQLKACQWRCLLNRATSFSPLKLAKSGTPSIPEAGAGELWSSRPAKPCPIKKSQESHKLVCWFFSFGRWLLHRGNCELCQEDTSGNYSE